MLNRSVLHQTTIQSNIYKAKKMNIAVEGVLSFFLLFRDSTDYIR